MTNLQMEHLVERWEDRRDVKNQMGKFVHYLLLKKEADMVEDLWSKRDDICYGVNDGWYAGARDWASAAGLLEDTGLTVSPEENCPRASVVTFLFRIHTM